MDQVEVAGLYKDYGAQRALFNVDLRLAAGEATLLLGDNGAGKSTLLNVLATLIEPTRGRVLYDGQPQAELDAEALRAEIGMLGHETRCYGDLTARENLRFFARLYGVGAAAERADQLLREVGLLAAADRQARTFSRGMLQRLALARTLLPGPGLLLLDEPYTGLDRQGVALLTGLLGRERDRGAVVLLTSHDLAAAAPLCDRAVVLRKGRVLRQGRFARGACTEAALVALYGEGS